MRYLVMALLIVRPLGCDREPEVILSPEPPVDRGPLPTVCEGWKPGPEPRPLAITENPPHPSLRSDRMICTAYGERIECDTFGDLNARWYESEYLWPKGPDGYRSPYGGGGGGCSEGSTNDQVECMVHVNDTEFNRVEEVAIICRGDRFCGRDKARECCQVKKRKKVFIPIPPEQLPTKEESDKWEKERCDRLEQRRKICEPFCTDPHYSAQCANYWGVTCGNGA